MADEEKKEPVAETAQDETPQDEAAEAPAAEDAAADARTRSVRSRRRLMANAEEPERGAVAI